MADVFDGLRAAGVSAESYTNGRVVIAGYGLGDRGYHAWIAAIGGVQQPDDADWAAVALAAVRIGHKESQLPQSIRYDVYGLTHGRAGKYEARKGALLRSFASYEAAQDYAEAVSAQRTGEIREEFERALARGSAQEADRLHALTDLEYARVYATLSPTSAAALV